MIKTEFWEMTGIEKDTIAEITNIVSKTASIVKIWHNVFFKSTLLNKYHSKCWKIKFSYLDWRTIMDARFPTNPRTPIIGNRSPSIVNFIAFRNHSILKLGFKKGKIFSLCDMVSLFHQSSFLLILHIKCQTLTALLSCIVI